MSTLLTAHSLRIDSPFGPVLNALSFTLKKATALALSVITAAAKARF